MIQFINGLTSNERKTAFVVDDTLYGRPFGKKVELCSTVYDHASKGTKFKSGFRLLTLGWTDGSTFVPVAFRHMSSQDQKQRYCEAQNLDRRSCGSRIRREAVKAMTEMLLVLLMNALRAGISAPYILFDSWFFSPKMAIQLHTIGLHTVSRVENTPKSLFPVSIVSDFEK